MSNLRILSTNSLGKLFHKVRNEDSFRKSYAEDKTPPDLNSFHMLATTIDLPTKAVELVAGGAPKDDAANAVKMYDYLGPLSRTQASDPRLWTTLCHSMFWEYCQERWPNADSQETHGKRVNYICEHWFVKPGAGLGALRRNAISRLWWAAHLTIAPWEHNSELNIFKTPDRTKYTRVLLSQAQIFQDVLERKFGSDLRLRICLLDALDKNLSAVSNKDDLMKDVAKKLNLSLKNKQLDALEINEMLSTIEKAVEQSVVVLNAA
jgi:hypothetical protein